MKDEEMAEESFEQYRTKDIDYVVSPYSEDNGTQKLMFNNEYDAEEEYFRFYKQGFLAGLKAGRPQWHKVADGDLPKDDEDMLMSEQLNLLTKMKGTDNLSISIGQYNFSTQEFSYPHFVGLTDVIAWCEIPTFNEE